VRRRAQPLHGAARDRRRLGRALSPAHRMNLTGRHGSIRQARSSDAPAIASLLGEPGYPTSRDDAKTRLERLLAREGSGALVYELEGKAAGIVAYQLIHFPGSSPGLPTARLPWKSVPRHPPSPRPRREGT
jgi:hypothetical protein